MDGVGQFFQDVTFQETQNDVSHLKDSPETLTFTIELMAVPREV